MRQQFGNLGLAAAAYNAGPHRVQEWLDGAGSMPQETRNYVSAITGTTVDDWAAVQKNGKPAARPPASPKLGCRELMALLRRAPNPFVTQLEAHVKLGAERLWGVQLAAGFDRDKALAMYARAISRLARVIGDQDPSLLGSVLRNRGSRTSIRCGSAPTRGPRRTTLQPHPPRRRRLLCAAKHGLSWLIASAAWAGTLSGRSLDGGRFLPRYARAGIAPTEPDAS